MSVDKNTVRKVARLARIAVPEERLEPLAGELNGTKSEGHAVREGEAALLEVGGGEVAA